MFPGPNEGQGRGRRSSLLSSAHAIIFHTPFPWHHGCVTSHVSITHVTHYTMPAQSLGAGDVLACHHARIPPHSQGLHAGAFQLTQSTAYLYSLTLSSHASVPLSHTLFLPVSTSRCPTLCLTLPLAFVHSDVFPLHPRPQCCVQFTLPHPSSCLLTSVSLPSFQKPVCQAGRHFFDSSTLSAKCTQISAALSALEK